MILGSELWLSMEVSRYFSRRSSLQDVFLLMRSSDSFRSKGPTIKNVKRERAPVLQAALPHSERQRGGVAARGLRYKTRETSGMFARAPPAGIKSTTKSSSVTVHSSLSPHLRTAKPALPRRIRHHVPASSPTSHPEAPALARETAGDSSTTIRDMRRCPLTPRALPTHPAPCGVDTSRPLAAHVRPQAHRHLPQLLRPSVATRPEALLAARRLRGRAEGARAQPEQGGLCGREGQLLPPPRVRGVRAGAARRRHVALAAAAPRATVVLLGRL